MRKQHLQASLPGFSDERQTLFRGDMSGADQQVEGLCDVQDLAGFGRQPAVVEDRQAGPPVARGARETLAHQSGKADAFQVVGGLPRREKDRACALQRRRLHRQWIHSAGDPVERDAGEDANFGEPFLEVVHALDGGPEVRFQQHPAHARLQRPFDEVDIVLARFVLQGHLRVDVAMQVDGPGHQLVQFHVVSAPPRPLPRARSRRAASSRNRPRVFGWRASHRPATSPPPAQRPPSSSGRLPGG